MIRLKLLSSWSVSGSVSMREAETRTDLCDEQRLRQLWLPGCSEINSEYRWCANMLESRDLCLICVVQH